jgi:hypothetical protein
MTTSSLTSSAHTGTTVSSRITPLRSRGERIGVVVLVTRNAGGEAQQVVVNHRPRSLLQFSSRLAGEKFGGEPFVASES